MMSATYYQTAKQSSSVVWRGEREREMESERQTGGRERNITNLAKR